MNENKLELIDGIIKYAEIIKNSHEIIEALKNSDLKNISLSLFIGSYRKSEITFKDEESLEMYIDYLDAVIMDADDKLNDLIQTYSSGEDDEEGFYTLTPEAIEYFDRKREGSKYEKRL